MSDAYWTSIGGLGEKRAKILADKLGIRSIEELHASTVNEIIEALDEAGSRATTGEVEAWLQAARTALKTETTPHWDSFVRAARTSQTVGGSTRTAEVGTTPALPLWSDQPIFIELEPAAEAAEIRELYFTAVAADREATVHYRPDRSSGAQRWLVLNVERGLYRMGMEAPDGSTVSGPIVQVV